MPRTWRARPVTDKSSVTEYARLYHSCVVALARSLGLPMSETFVLQFHNAISSIFIASDKAGVRLPPAVQLPPLGAPNAPTNGPPVEPVTSPPGDGELEDRASPNGDAPQPTSIPADGDLPCRGQEIASLKPAQLAMLVSKVARLVQDQGAAHRSQLKL